MNSTQAHLLLVDDVAQNIQIVASMLKTENYRLSFALNGETALQLIQKEMFDLILLDIQMPDLDGFKVCQQLKHNPLTAEIPVIFITANADTRSTVRAFQVGAVDYLTKPLAPLELRARVKTHLDLKQARDQIVQQNHKLEALNQERSQLLRIVSHDLRSPLTVMTSGLEFIQSALHNADERLQRRLSNMRISCERMGNMIHNLLSNDAIVSGNRTLAPQFFSVRHLLQSLCRQHHEWAETKGIKLVLETEDDLAFCSDRDALEQVLDNLLSNAIKFSPYHTEVLLKAKRLSTGQLQLEIIDQGPGFSKVELACLFRTSGPLSAEPTAGESSFGLGLGIVKRTLLLLGGDVHCTSKAKQGAHFIIQLNELQL